MTEHETPGEEPVDKVPFETRAIIVRKEVVRNLMKAHDYEDQKLLIEEADEISNYILYGKKSDANR